MANQTPDIGIKEKVGSIEPPAVPTPATKTGGRKIVLAAVKRLNRKVSSILLNAKMHRQRQEQIEPSAGAKLQARTMKSMPNLKHANSMSPVKEQMALEVDRASKHEDVNKGFFASPQRKKKSASQLKNNGRPDSELFK